MIFKGWLILRWGLSVKVLLSLLLHLVSHSKTILKNKTLCSTQNDWNEEREEKDDERIKLWRWGLGRLSTQNHSMLVIPIIAKPFWHKFWGFEHFEAKLNILFYSNIFVMKGKKPIRCYFSFASSQSRSVPTVMSCVSLLRLLPTLVSLFLRRTPLCVVRSSSLPSTTSTLRRLKPTKRLECCDTGGRRRRS